MARPSHLRMLGSLAAVLALLASAGAALAQEESNSDILGRHLGATAEAASAFGTAGMTLPHISSGLLEGTGSMRRDTARRIERAFEPWRGAATATKRSLPFRVLPNAMLVSDVAVSVVAPALEGDYRGAMGGAATIAVAPTVITAGTAVFGSLGAGAGAFVGSVIPVVGTAFGGVVGGAIGKVAGGYLSAFAYDKWIKQWVAESAEAGISGAQGLIEAGIASLRDKGSLQEAMHNRDQFFYEQSIPEMRVVWDQLRSTGLGPDSVELTGPEQTPYIVQTPPDAPPGEEQPPGGPGGTLSGAIEIVVWNPEYPDWRVSEQCVITGKEIRCKGSRTDANLYMTYSFEGSIDGWTATGEYSEVMAVTDPNCNRQYSLRHKERYAFEAEGSVRVDVSASEMRLTSSSCDAVAVIATPAQTVVGTWRNIE